MGKRWIWDGEKLVEPGACPPQHPSKRAAFAAPRIASDYQAYDCPVTGTMIEGRTAHRENLKRQGCRLLEPGETRTAAKRQEESFEAGLREILK